MHREIQVFRLIVLALFLCAVAVAFYAAHMTFIAHSHGRDFPTQVVGTALTAFFVILAAIPAWLCYLMFSRFLTGVEVASGGYALRTSKLQREHVVHLSAVHKIGGLEGPNELTVVRADGRYWVCLSADLA